MEESYYWDLIARHLSGKASPEEEKELESWLKKDFKNKEVYDIQKSLWKNTDGTALEFEVDKAWNKLNSKIGTGNKKQKTSFRPIYRIAASLAIFTLISFLIGYFINQWQNIILVEAPSTHKIEVTLPDKTIVWLNKNSRLTYSKGFGNETREVTLEGEAFFEVTHDKEKPFLIHTEKTVTQVLGTSFNVKNWEGSKKVEVAVLTGKVAFYEKGLQENALSLLPGEKGVFDANEKRLVKAQSRDNNFMAWKSGILKFEDASLPEALKTLEEYYEETIQISPSLSNCKITTTIENQPLERVLMELQILLDIDFERKGGELFLSGSGCQNINRP